MAGDIAVLLYGHYHRITTARGAEIGFFATQRAARQANAAYLRIPSEPNDGARRGNRLFSATRRAARQANAAYLRIPSEPNDGARRVAKKDLIFASGYCTIDKMIK